MRIQYFYQFSTESTKIPTAGENGGEGEAKETPQIRVLDEHITLTSIFRTHLTNVYMS